MGGFGSLAAFFRGEPIPTYKPDIAVDSANAARAPDGMVVNVHRPMPARALGRDELIALAKKAAVPLRVQIGPACGLYALGMVMDGWHLTDPSWPTALVRDEDLAGKGTHYKVPPTTDDRILDYAVERGFTRNGEMFVAENVARTADHFGYRATIYDDASMEDLYAVVDAGHPAIVPFDVDANGNPGELGGLRAHYAVIEGYFDEGGERWLVAKHGWGFEADHVWRAADFEASWNGLEETGYYQTGGGDPTLPELPEGVTLPKVSSDRHGIAQSLRRKLIEVVPKAIKPAGGRVVHAGGGS